MNLRASLGVGTPPPVVDAPIGKTNPRERKHHGLTGYSDVRKSFSFVLWAQAQHDFPTFERVMQQFECSKATAYRLIGALRDAYGLPPLREVRE